MNILYDNFTKASLELSNTYIPHRKKKNLFIQIMTRFAP